MSMPPFTAHNIELDDGTWTLPGAPPVAGNEICRAALALLARHVPAGARVADLGALEGGYAVAFARAGYRVTAVEARARNMARCQYVADRAGVPRELEFVRDDARNLASWGSFDAVFCCGLLYHLDRPAEFLAMLGSLTGRLLILQTHYSVRPDAVNEGLPGHWYGENPAEESAWSSWGNDRSFWLAEQALLDAVRDAGFSEAARYPGGVIAGTEADRAMFTGVKPS
jgi:SAM-dependent methyltransferase